MINFKGEGYLSSSNDKLATIYPQEYQGRGLSQSHLVLFFLNLLVSVMKMFSRLTTKVLDFIITTPPAFNLFCIFLMYSTDTLLRLVKAICKWFFMLVCQD